MKLEGQIQPGCEIDVKRFYMPGVVLSGTCPECDEPYVHDFKTHHLSYPGVGANEHTCYCSECDHEWGVTLTLSMAVSLTDTTP